MNYLKVYCNLIRKAENRTPPEGYTEKHHTFPKSIYGNNSRIVVLTGREHYIAHALLEKAFIKRYGVKDKRTIKMTYAHVGMKGNDGYINSYLYESARKRKSEYMKGKPLYIPNEEQREKMRQRRLGTKASNETKRKMSEVRKGKKLTPRSEEWKKQVGERMKKNVGEKNPFYGKRHTEDTKKKISNSKKGKKSKQNILRTSKYLYKIKDPFGQIFLTRNLKDFCRRNNLHPTCMRRTISGQQNQHKGWKIFEKDEIVI